VAGLRERAERAVGSRLGRLPWVVALLAWHLLLIGTATFSAGAAELPFSSPPPIGAGQQSAAFVDVDGDGDLDVIGSDFTTDLVWFENTGSVWTQHPIDPGGAGSFAVAGGDVDGDGDVDVVATCCASTSPTGVAQATLLRNCSRWASASRMRWDRS
jgi:hypothetical protein